MASLEQTHLQEFVIEPPKGWISLGLKEVWAYRHMIYFLAMRNITAAYKQTVLGPLWVIINPFVSMIAYSIIFGVVADVPTYGIPYPIFNYTALIPWTLFVSTLGTVTSSITSNADLINKVYFPRLVLPLVATAETFVNFFLASILLGVMMVWYGYTPTVNAIFLPYFVFIALVTSLGVGLWFAPLEVKSRDMRHVVGYISRFWFYFTPVLYARESLPEPLRVAAGFNPMTGVAEGFRWALLGIDTQPDAFTLVSGVIGLFLLISGAFFFKRMEKIFADIA